MTNVWISAGGLFAATVIGSVFGFAVRQLPHKWNDTVLGYCAGIMLAASTLGLIVPAFETDTTPSWMVTAGVMAIALQNIPEAMVIIAPLLLAGVNRLRTLAISIVIGLLEMAGVWIGYALGSVSDIMLPVMLGFAGGAMLYVTSDEMIPETHFLCEHKIMRALK